MNRFRKLIGQWRSTEQHLERLRGDNEAALEALYFLQERGHLQDGTLRNSVYEKVRWELATLAAAHLEGINLRGANLQGVYLHETHLENADLTEVTLINANLRAVHLLEAVLERAILHQANLARADLRAVNLRGADLQGANLWLTDLRGADLRQAVLHGASIYSVQADPATLLPDGTPWHPAVDWVVFTQNT